MDGEGRATLQYRFTLTRAVNQPGESTTREEIRFSVNGQQTRAPGLLRVNILNDAPVAAADDNSIDQIAASRRRRATSLATTLSAQTAPRRAAR